MCVETAGPARLMLVLSRRIEPPGMSETVILERPRSNESAKNDDTHTRQRPAPRSGVVGAINKRTRRPAPAGESPCANKNDAPSMCNRPARNSTRAIRRAPRRGVGWRKQKSKARSGRVPRRGLRNSGLGTGPLRDRPRTGFRSGHLRKRDIPHTVSLMPCGLGRSPCPHRARDASGSGCPTRASRDASHAALAGWARGLWGRRRRRG